MVGALETSAPPKSSTNKAIRGSPLDWCTFYLVGAVETTAPPKAPYKRLWLAP